MKMFMIVSAGDSLKRWFPVDRIVRISEESERTLIAHMNSRLGSYTARSSITVLNEEGLDTTYYSTEEAESMVDRLETVCWLS